MSSTIREVLEAQDRMSATLRIIASNMERLEQQTKSTNAAAQTMATMNVGAMLLKGVNMAIGAGREFLELANDQIRAEKQLAVVMRNQGMDNGALQRLKAQAKEMSTMVPYGDELLIAAQAELATYLKTEDALSGIMNTMADYAAGMGGVNVTQQQMSIDLTSTTMIRFFP